MEFGIPYCGSYRRSGTFSFFAFFIGDDCANIGIRLPILPERTPHINRSIVSQATPALELPGPEFGRHRDTKRAQDSTYPKKFDSE